MLNFLQILPSIWIHGPTSDAPLYLCHHNQPLSTISINSIQFLERTILIPKRRLCTPLWILLNSSRIQNKNLFLHHLDIIHTIATLIVFWMLLTYKDKQSHELKKIKIHQLLTFLLPSTFGSLICFSLGIHLGEIPSYSISSHTTT
jgi:hypothetical protein